MQAVWPLARVDDADAFWFDAHLLLVISGTAPDPCYRIDIDQTPLDVEPPTFIARWSRGRGLCPAIETPYVYRETFAIGGFRETIVVRHEGGELLVPVHDYAPDMEAFMPVVLAPNQGTAIISNAIEPLTGASLPLRDAIGYSDAWDLREAMRDAIRRLPPQRPDVDDWLARYELVSVGAELGGYAGLDRLFVRVRG